MSFPHTRVLTDTAQIYGTCDAYCAEQETSLTCVGAWEDFDDTCQIFDDRAVNCWTNFSETGTSDMICECSDFSQGRVSCFAYSSISLSLLRLSILLGWFLCEE